MGSTAGYLGIFLCWRMRRALRARQLPLVEICVFGLGLLQNGNVRVRIFPESKEILIGGFCPGLITRKHVSPAELDVCQSTNGIADNNTSVIENFLEFPGGVGALMCG